MKLISNSKQYRLFLFIFTFAVLFMDQTFKYIFTNDFSVGNSYRNHNYFWGLPQIYFLFTLVFLIIFFLIKQNYLRLFFKKSNLGFLLLLAGIISNSIDVIFKGYITDYISFYNLFSFNVADMAIISGAFLLSWKILQK
ncbi:signal peptidase II [Patescibacteria group bacterium]|nr:signal peptidase II [Patescibacteria group bacterium]